MNTRTIRVAATLSGAVLAGALLPAAAHAETDVVRDPRGDAPRAVDITKLRVAHGTYRVKGTLTIPHLKKRKAAATELILKPRKSGGWTYHVGVWRGRQGKVRSLYLGWMHRDDPASWQTLPCNGIRTSATKKKLKISVPNRCLTESPSGRRLKGKAGILARIGPGHDSFDEMTRYTPWLRQG
ncbi:hypothetical protein CLV56_1803 [Mumia flava]|uniref:Uncharacterized protein n=1 Tax=Mumia flava TaxID=1348852 RepID=A0A0B2B7A1_9ACTN|nr:hypothetical protein [Mumia flava]PJJ57568.1 hypothetical protein CLV56_1803 [Mumia flava]